jgi:hypothetical protein
VAQTSHLPGDAHPPGHLPPLANYAPKYLANRMLAKVFILISHTISFLPVHDHLRIGRFPIYAYIHKFTVISEIAKTTCTAQSHLKKCLNICITTLSPSADGTITLYQSRDRCYCCYVHCYTAKEI